MNHHARMLGPVGLAVLLLGCSETRPPVGVPVDAPSGKVDPTPCQDGQAWQEALRALPAAAVAHIEPTYFRDTCAGTALVSGTKLSITTEAIQTAPWARLLECHTARVRFTTTSATAPEGSPGWTPVGWVDIAVEREPKDLTLTLRAESAAKNIRLFHSAIAFVDPTRN